jgi:transcriptional regulator with XRE-family HTH domain
MTEKYTQADGRRLYEEERARRMADPEYRASYDEVAAEKALGLRLVEARQAAGLTRQQVAGRLGVSPAQVARIENHGYACSLRSLRRHVAALGDGFALDVRIRQSQSVEARQIVERTYGDVESHQRPTDLKALRELYEEEVALEVLAETPAGRSSLPEQS